MTGYNKDYILTNDKLEAAALRDAQVKQFNKQKRERKMAYEVDMSSGVDVAIRRTMAKTVRGGAHETRRLTIMASQKQAYIEVEHTGEIKILDPQAYAHFWSDMDKDDVFTNEYRDENGNEDLNMVWDGFGRTTSWCDSVCTAMASDKFIQLAKAGLMTISIWHDLHERGSSTRGAWWGHRYSDKPLDKDVVKLVQYLVSRATSPTKSRKALLMEIYSQDRYGDTDQLRYNPEAIMSFIIIMSAYDINIAKLAIDMYVDNPLLCKLKPTNLAGVLWANPDMKKSSPWGCIDNPLVSIINSEGEDYRSYNGSQQIRYFNPVIHYKVRKIRDENGNVVDTETIKLEENGFLNYLFGTSRRCGYADILATWEEVWEDTLIYQMKSSPTHEVKDKYPDNERALEKAAYKVRCMEKDYDPKAWEAAAERVAKFDQRNDEWSLIAPKAYEELIDEGMMMDNCVMTLKPPEVLAGRTNIMFLRRTRTPDLSVCSVEITDDGRVIQFKSHGNLPATREQRMALVSLMVANRKKRGLPTDNIHDFINY